MRKYMKWSGFIELFLQLETGCKYQQKGKKEVTHVVATWDGAGGVGGGVVSSLLRQVFKKKNSESGKVKIKHFWKLLLSICLS